MSMVKLAGSGQQASPFWSLLLIGFLASSNIATFCLLYTHLHQIRNSGEIYAPTRVALEMDNSLGKTVQTQSEKLSIFIEKQQKQTRQQTSASQDWDVIAHTHAEQMSATWENVSSSAPWWERPGYHLAFFEPTPQYPFQRIKFIDGKDTGVIAIAAPFYDRDYYRAETARALFWRLKSKGHIMVGIMSYQEFPDRIKNPWDDRHTTEQDKAIIMAVDAWLHCAREPDKVLPPGVPRLLLSESDFPDPERNDGGGKLIPDPTIAKKFDIVLSNQGGDWNSFNRNWTLAKAALKRLTQELKFSVLVLGRNFSNNDDPCFQDLQKTGQIETRPPGKPWREFLRSMQEARILFVPNIHDASPRVVTEAMSLDIPVLMNKHIVGGWKYINNETGEFFSSADDVVHAAKKLIDPARAAKLQPRHWFKTHWGKWRSTYKLQAFIEAAVGQKRLKAIQRDLANFEAEKSAHSKYDMEQQQHMKTEWKRLDQERRA